LARGKSVRLTWKRTGLNVKSELGKGVNSDPIIGPLNFVF
jgi:hypothetical protein